MRGTTGAIIWRPSPHGFFTSRPWTLVRRSVFSNPRERSVEKHSQDNFAEPQISPLRSPGFSVENRGVDPHHAVFFKENRTRGRCQQREEGNPGTLRSR
jgi:hypothetical protein